LIGYLDSENQNVQLEICIVCSETGPKLVKLNETGKNKGFWVI